MWGRGLIEFRKNYIKAIQRTVYRDKSRAPFRSISNLPFTSLAHGSPQGNPIHKPNITTTNMPSDNSSETPESIVKAGWKAEGIAAKYARAETATRPYAEIFLSKANLTDPNREINAFDMGCGTGAVIAALYDTVPKEQWPNVKVLAGDVSEDMLSFVRNRGTENGWPGLTTQIVNGADGLEPNQFTHVFANAIVFFLPTTTLKKTYDLLKPGGFIGMTTWAALPWFAWVQKAVSRLPNPPSLISYEQIQSAFQQGNAWHEEAFVKKQLEEAGFKDVEVVYEKVRARGGTLDEFMEMMTMPMKVVSSFWEEGEREEILGRVMGELRKVVEEENFEDGVVTMNMEGLVGVGWKR